MSIFGAIAVAISSGVISLSSQLPASYELQVRLDTSSHEISGSEKISFLNPADYALRQISFHLYPNAFRDTSTAYAREERSVRNDILSGKTSSLAVSNVSVDGTALDSGAVSSDGTFLRLTLPRALPPGDSIRIGLDFLLKIPPALMRLGYDHEGNYLLSHWHPILCGFQRGRIIENEYHANSEFFSNFSNYQVRLEIPPDFKIGSTGDLTLVTKDSSRAIWSAIADTVIDFAFACGPAFELFESDTLGIKLRYLIQKDHLKLKDIADQMTRFSLAYNSEKFFSYPYKAFTMVDFNAGADGMELPGMNVIAFPAEKLRSAAATMLRLTIAHEVTHEWFYAIVASNEADEPWLDEGVTSYVTDRLLEAGGDSLQQFEIFGYRIDFRVFDRMTGLLSKAEYPVNLKSWEYPDDFSYSAAVYSRANLVLRTLEQWVGRDKFDIFLKDYAVIFRFRHPVWEDIINAAATRTHNDMTRFFYQFINGTARVDYGVRSLRYKVLPDTGTAKSYEIKVIVARELDGALPQRLSIALENGSSIDTLWEGAARGQAPRVQEITLVASSKPLSASLIPYALDEDASNNTLYMKSLGSRLISFEWDMIFIKEFFLSLFL